MLYEVVVDKKDFILAFIATIIIFVTYLMGEL